MTSRTLTSLGLAAVLLCVAGVARADNSFVTRADQFIRLFRQRQFRECSNHFHYPPTYTPVQLANDSTSVAHSLEVIFQELGDIGAATRGAKLTGTYLDLEVGGGDIPYWSSHPELSRVQEVIYAAQTSNEGRVLLAVHLIQFQRKWRLRSFVLLIPASRPGAQQFISELGRKMLNR